MPLWWRADRDDVHTRLSQQVLVSIEDRYIETKLPRLARGALTGAAADGNDAGMRVLLVRADVLRRYPARALNRYAKVAVRHVSSFSTDVERCGVVVRHTRIARRSTVAQAGGGASGPVCCRLPPDAATTLFGRIVQFIVDEQVRCPAQDEGGSADGSGVAA